MTLTPARRTHAAVLAALHAEAFDEPWSQSEIADVLGWPGVFGLLAGGETPTGMIVARVAADDAEILTLAVRPAARRSGVARALLAETLRLSIQAGADAMFLEVAVDNESAIALYQAAGFVVAGRRKAYYDRGVAGSMDALALRLDLSNSSG